MAEGGRWSAGQDAERGGGPPGGPPPPPRAPAARHQRERTADWNLCGGCNVVVLLHSMRLMAVASTNSLVSREDSTSRAAATITWTAAVLAGTVGVGDAVPYDPVPIPMPKGSTLQALHTVSGFSTSSSLEGVLKGDEVASLMDCNDERRLRTRRKPTRHKRHSKISKGDVGTVLGACDDESKSDKADRVYVDFDEGKGRADFVKQSCSSSTGIYYKIIYSNN